MLTSSRVLLKICFRSFRSYTSKLSPKPYFGDINKHYEIITKQIKETNFVPIMECCELIETCMFTGKIYIALSLYNIMSKHGFYPHQRTFTILLKGFINKNKVEQAEKILYSSVNNQRDYHYNMLIHAYINRNDITQAFNVLGKMIAANHQPNVITYEKLLKIALEYGTTEHFEILKHIEKHCKIEKSEVTYGSIINRLCKLNRVEIAIKYLEEMKNAGIRPNLIIYNTLLDALAKHDLSKAAELLKTMIAENYTPDIITITTLLKEIPKNNNVDSLSLKELLDQFSKLCNGISDETFINVLLRAFIQTGQVYHAKELFERVVSQGMKPNVKTITTLISGLAQISNSAEITKLIQFSEQMKIELDSGAYKAIIRGYCNAGEMDNALRYLDKARSLKEKPSVRCYNYVIDALVQRGKFEKAKQILQLMKNDKVEPDMLTMRFETLISEEQDFDGFSNTSQTT